MQRPERAQRAPTAELAKELNAWCAKRGIGPNAIDSEELQAWCVKHKVDPATARRIIESAERHGGPGTTIVAKPGGAAGARPDRRHRHISADEIGSARREAHRRIAARDEREARRAIRDKRIGLFLDAIGAAVSELAATFPRFEDGEPDPGEQQASKALVAAHLACNPPETDDDEIHDAEAGDAHAPAVVSPTLQELQAVLRRARCALQTVCAPQHRARRAVYEVVVEQLRALCEAARATGTVNESELAGCDPRLADALKRERADRAEQEAWRLAPSRRAQPGETLTVLTARVLVERGHKCFAAARAVGEQSSSEAACSWLRKAVDRAVKEQRAREVPLLIPEPSPEELVELERLLSELRDA